jgi:hypothetical protein
LPSGLADAAFREGLSFNQDVEGMADAIGLWPTGCNPDLVTPSEVNSPEDDTWKQTAAMGDPVTFQSFLVYEFLQCPGGQFNPAAGNRDEQVLLGTFNAIKHIGVAQQLWYGKADNVNPALRDVATVLQAGTAETVLIAIAKLLAAHKTLGTGRTLIHGPWELVPHLRSLNLIEKRGTNYEGLGFTYITDEGYPTTVNAGPLQTPPSTFYADVADQAWLYATGQIEFAWGKQLDNSTIGIEPDVEGNGSRYMKFDARLNRVMYRVEQQAFLRFDPKSVLAQRVAVPT